MKLIKHSVLFYLAVEFVAVHPLMFSQPLLGFENFSAMTLMQRSGVVVSQHVTVKKNYV